MKINWNIVGLLLQLVLGILFLVYIRYCEQPAREVQSFHKETKIYYDSSEKRPAAAAPPAATITRTIGIPARVDTAAILRKFYTERYYEQTFGDSSFRATVSNTVSENELKRQVLSYKQLSPVKTIESTTVTLSPHGFYGGGFVTGKTGYFGLGPKLSYLTKKEALIGAGVDLLNRSATIDAQFKLRWKK